MATLDIPREYADGEIYTQADVDDAYDAIETFINTTKLNDDNLQNDGITGSQKLINATVTAAKLATDSVTTAKIVDSSVTTAKIADDAITLVKMADNSVGTAELIDSSVTTAKILDANVTAAKLAPDAIALCAPAGSIVAWGGSLSAYTDAPTGWLACWGHAVSQASYPTLYAAIGAAFGDGSTGTDGSGGASKFNLPDFRGYFLRGMDVSAGRDPDVSSRTAMAAGGNTGGSRGSVQGHNFFSHTHVITTHQNDNLGTAPSNRVRDALNNSADNTSTTSVTAASTGGNETRPINAGVHYIIKL